ncbi:hypothetical protein Pint_00923 [Pistacia integerrima]|uniref:Uncharacterized protein n=1 Tax=Pistacia integerrima TaxID=434235 RepID=A0ACC0ZPY4_9ROSI|nr:hypothetical protein Pint_00923 [Pistacia integerrima]
MSNTKTCYYSVLGLRKQASASEIRDAYWKLALKRNGDFSEYKRLMQFYQKGKRRVYDAGLLSLLADDEDEGCSLRDLQGLLMDMMGEKERIKFQNDSKTSQAARKKIRVS